MEGRECFSSSGQGAEQTSRPPLELETHIVQNSQNLKTYLTPSEDLQLLREQNARYCLNQHRAMLQMLA